MATAPKDRVGNASGVLSTMRQVGSLMGIAVLGAVLQNRVTANITEGVQAISQIPEATQAEDHRRREQRLHADGRAERRLVRACPPRRRR